MEAGMITPPTPGGCRIVPASPAKGQSDRKDGTRAAGLEVGPIFPRQLGPNLAPRVEGILNRFGRIGRDAGPFVGGRLPRLTAGGFNVGAGPCGLLRVCAG